MPVGIGIEVGPASVRAAVIERSPARGRGPLSLVAAFEVPCETSNAEALTAALAQVRRTLRIRRPITLGIPSTAAILTTVSPLVVSARRASLAVQFELQQHLPFRLADAVWHYRWLSGENGRRPAASAGPHAPSHPLPEAIVAAMKRSLLEERLASCRRADLSVGAVVVNPIATLNAWHLAQASRLRPPGQAAPPAVVLLNLLTDGMAEWIVWSPGMVQVVPVTSPSPEDLWPELMGSLEVLSTQLSGGPSHVWLIGPPMACARALELLRTRSELQVERLELAPLVAPRGVRPEQMEQAVTALGLALHGLGLAHIPLNLLASLQRAQQSRRLSRIAAITSGVLLLAGVGLGLSGMLEVRHRRALILRSLEERERLFQSLRPEVRALLQRQQHTERRSLQLEQLIGDRAGLAELLARIAEALPDRVWLTTLDCSRNGSAPTAEPTQPRIVDGLLEGRAPSFADVTQLLDRLKGVAGMTSVKPLSTNIVTDPVSGKELVAFTIQIQR